MHESRPKRPVKTATTVFEIIELILDSDGLTVTEIADQLGMAKSTIHRHLTTLVELGYLNKVDRRYTVGLKFLDYGTRVRNNYRIFHAARSELTRIANDTGEVVWLVVEENGEAVYIDYRVGEDGVRTRGRIGKRTHLHYLAAGKAILAYLPQQRIDWIIDRHGLPARTDRTITDPNRLNEDLEIIREQGYAFNENEEITGVRAVGAPIIYGGEVMGAISIAGPDKRMERKRFKETLPEVILDAANTIELKLEFE